VDELLLPPHSRMSMELLTMDSCRLLYTASFWISSRIIWARVRN
jgi:hypothetical protein